MLQATDFSKGHGMSLEVSLEVKGQNLKQQVATQTGIDVYRLKLICTGRVIDDENTLREQNVKV